MVWMWTPIEDSSAYDAYVPLPHLASFSTSALDPSSHLPSVTPVLIKDPFVFTYDAHWPVEQYLFGSTFLSAFLY